jgi:ZIP family zinc transporter
MLYVAGGNVLLLGLLGGLITSLLNAVGTLPVLFMPKPRQKFLDIGLGFSAGIMLAASFTSLIIPGIGIGGIFPVVIGILLGAIAVTLSDMFIPHLHFVIGEDSLISSRLRAIWLFAIAITLHNMPEGLAVGVGFGAGGKHMLEAVTLMMGIGLQNIPEGLSVGFYFWPPANTPEEGRSSLETYLDWSRYL